MVMMQTLKKSKPTSLLQQEMRSYDATEGWNWLLKSDTQCDTELWLTGRKDLTYFMYL